jgi:tetratricopeptide (TPR) repeat protein
MKVGRNLPCPCGSGKKYKNCCDERNAAPEKVGIELLFMQAQRAHSEGRLVEAQTLYASILDRDPNNPEATHFQGLIAHQTGQTQLALNLIERSLLLRPQNVHFLTNAGLIYQAIGNWKMMEASYRKLTQLSPDDTKAWHNLGHALVQVDNTNEAIEAYRRAASLSKFNSALWTDLAVRLIQRGQPADLDEAIERSRKAINLSPNDAEGYNNLAVALGLLQRRDEAVKAAQMAIKLAPQSSQPWLNLARIYILSGEVNSALDAYEKGAALAPDVNLFYRALANLLTEAGKFNDAIAFFKLLYERNPKDLEVLGAFIRHQKFTSADDPLLLKARASVDAANDTEGASILCFALGSILDKLEQYATAFDYYGRGNRIRAKTLQYNREAHHQYIDSIIQQYDASAIAKLRTLGNPSGTPIIIVGMPRSGTTLTEQIIAAHPKVAGGGERDFWEIHEPKGVALDQHLINNLAQACLNDLAIIPGASQAHKTTDKLPSNFLRVGLIHAVFPNARIIHVRRHPVDNCLSIFFQSFNEHHQYAFDQENLVHYRHEYERLMQHWREVMPANRYFEFDYENLVADQEGISRKLIDFCGLEWDDACLSYHQNEQTIRTASVWQVRQKIYTTSVERWRHYEPYIKPLMALLGTPTEG